MAKANQTGGSLLSFRPEHFSAGGLLPDGKYLLQNCQVLNWDYDGKIQGTTCAFMMECQPITVDAKGKITTAGEVRKQYYSAGDSDKIGPSGDGTGFVAINASGLSDSSNFAIFVKNLVGAGFDEFDNDVTVLNGLGVEIQNIPMPKREGLPQSNLVQAGPPQPERQRNIPVVKYIGKLPNEKVWNGTGIPSGAAASAPARVAPTAAKAVAAKTNGSAAAIATPEGGVEEVLTTTLNSVIGGADAMDRTQVRLAAFKAMGAQGVPNDQRKAAMDLFNNDDSLTAILQALDMPYKLEGTNITLE